MVEHELAEPLSGFARWTWSPPEWSPVSHYVDAGLVALQKVGLAVAWLDLSDDLPGHSHEIVVEATWREEVAPWWSLQPDVQMIVHPGGASTEDSLFIVGLRTEIVF